MHWYTIGRKDDHHHDHHGHHDFYDQPSKQPTDALVNHREIKSNANTSQDGGYMCAR